MIFLIWFHDRICKCGLCPKLKILKCGTFVLSYDEIYTRRVCVCVCVYVCLDMFVLLQPCVCAMYVCV